MPARALRLKGIGSGGNLAGDQILYDGFLDGIEKVSENWNGYFFEKGAEQKMKYIVKSLGFPDKKPDMLLHASRLE